jgi:hypothetical protein
MHGHSSNTCIFNCEKKIAHIKDDTLMNINWSTVRISMKNMIKLNLKNNDSYEDEQIT